MNIAPPRSNLDANPDLPDPEWMLDVKQPLVPRGRMLPYVLVTALFFLWGVPNNLNDILIRQFMKSF